MQYSYIVPLWRVALIIVYIYIRYKETHDQSCTYTDIFLVPTFGPYNDKLSVYMIKNCELKINYQN